MSGHPGPPWDALSALPSVAKRDLGERMDPSNTAKSNRSGGAARMQWEPATTSSSPASSLCAHRFWVLACEQDPRDSYCPPSCALPCLRSIFHVSRSHVSGYLWPSVPGSARLAAPRGWGTSVASPLKHRREPKSLPLCKEAPCLGFPAGKSERKETPFFLNTQWLLRQTNTIKEGLRGLIRLHRALEILSFTDYGMKMAAVTCVLHAASLMQSC